MSGDGLERIELARLIVASAAWIGRLRGSSRSRHAAAKAEAIKELRGTVAALPPLDEARLSSETGDAWSRHRRKLRRMIAFRDPASFLIWNPIVRSMTLGVNPTIRAEFLSLRDSDQWKPRWSDAVKENRTGLPMPRYISPFTSGTLIHHAYHVHRFETVIERSILDFDEIVEFGGGYGSMARLVARLGFRGRYHIHDLPEFSALQRFYLRLIRAEIGTGSVSDVLSRVTLSDRPEDASPSAGGKVEALFMATWSLSEAPIRLREEWRPALARFSSFLFGFQGQFEDMDNRSWFEEFASSRPDVAWRLEPIRHRNDAFYLFGLPAKPNDVA